MSIPAPNPTNTDPAPARSLPSHNWRRSPRIRERLLRVAGLRQRGHNQAQIAARLGVSRPTISRDLQRLELLWRQEHTHLANAERLRSLATLRETERLCWSLIDQHHTDIDRLPDVTAAARNLIAAQREIRHLLADVRAPQPNDYWGFDTLHRRQHDLLPLTDTHQPNPDDLPDPNPVDLRAEEIKDALHSDLRRYMSPDGVAMLERALRYLERHPSEPEPAGGPADHTPPIPETPNTNTPDPSRPAVPLPASPASEQWRTTAPLRAAPDPHPGPHP